MGDILSYYSAFDEWGRLDREPLEFQINFRHIRQLLPASCRILDNGAGPGKYAVELAKLGHRVTLSDLTPRLVDVAREKAKAFGVEAQFDGFHIADARDLGAFPAERFDAALMLGPLYHLQREEDRVRAVSELHRVTKQDGYIFVAFMSRTRFLATSVAHPEAWKPNHTAPGIRRFLDTGNFDHADPGRFTGAYYFDIPDIVPFMEAHGFAGEKLVGSSSIAGGMGPEQWAYWRERGGEEYEGIMNLVLRESENPHILGLSSHLLYIGRKR
ncbi:class I SAM-dependent methyltransferase [Paenibacillus sp. MWE-103]|uniref:Class I SAM-dependent methyltransferase n=1 Tax=Paenibacillus artemisiicola TaxID=1172618 RepID=A0ABS3WJD7_9BACL|nr:class I SAM-dependent methyltransferase [Paenibacillus artemisiicola]MBO7748430.1 class I SAM-dependent methyltransferase [Paenibacillus artemisiicola]